MSITIREALEAVAIISAMIAVIAIPNPAEADKIEPTSHGSRQFALTFPNDHPDRDRCRLADGDRAVAAVEHLERDSVVSG